MWCIECGRSFIFYCSNSTERAVYIFILSFFFFGGKNIELCVRSSAGSFVIFGINLIEVEIAGVFFFILTAESEQ